MSQNPTPAFTRKPHHYWWLLLNLLAGCAAVSIWIVCLHVFGHPEIPRNYDWLKRLDLAKPPVGFALQEAPPGDAADPRALYRRYAQLEPEAMRRLNAALLRNYLVGLEESGLIQYVEGRFLVTEVRPLDKTDLFSDGFAVRGRAVVQPDEFTEAAPWPVILDYLFPTKHPTAAEWFRPGDELEVSKVPNCAMVMHIARVETGDTPMVYVTAVPIAMGEYRAGKGQSFTISTPESLNPAARLPAFEPEPEAEE